MNYEEVFSYEHLFESAKKCCNGVRWKCSTQNFEMNMAMWVHELHKQLMDGTYKTKGFYKFTIFERGKERKIQAVHISERCVQKCLCNYYLKPTLVPKLIYDNAASIENKGTDFALMRLRKHLTRHFKKYGRTGGILLQDYHDYFASIDRERLKSMLRNDLDDERLYDITCDFIDAMKGNRGLGLGSEVYQILAVYYPNKIDHFVKEQLHIKGYGRYMDDSYMIHHDIEYLKECKKAFKEESLKLGIQMNDNHTQIIRLDKNFNFLKKRFFITETGKIVMRLSRKNVRTRRRQLKKMAKNGIDAEESYTSWRGYAKKCDSYNTLKTMDKLYYELFVRKETV